MNTSFSDLRLLSRSFTSLDLMFCSLPVALLGMAILSLL